MSGVTLASRTVCNTRPVWCLPPFALRAPQEGELRPQLLDRFGMSVNVATLQDTKLRTQLVMDR